MTVIEKKVWVHPEGNAEKQPVLKTLGYEIYGVEMPKEMNFPAVLRLTGCAPIYLNCSHQDSDVFLAQPVTLWQYAQLRWHRFWNKAQRRDVPDRGTVQRSVPITRRDTNGKDGIENNA